GTLTFFPEVRTCAPAPAAPPASVPMIAPLAPPASAPMTAPASAPPPAYLAVVLLAPTPLGLYELASIMYRLPSMVTEVRSTATLLPSLLSVDMVVSSA